MAESHSETSYDELLEILKWNAASLVAILDQHGGKALVRKEVLESIDLGKEGVRIVVTEEGDYLIERIDISAV